MSEKKLVVDQLKFTYEGLFDLKGLYKVMSSFFYERGYDWFERLNTEQVMPTGRQIRIELIPWKNITDYFRIHVKIRLVCTDVKKVEVEQHGSKIPLDEGRVMIVFDGYVESDRHNQWENSPLRWFLRTIFDKKIFKGHFLKAEQWLVSDIEDIQGRVKSFLNVYRYPEKGIVTHEMRRIS